MSPASLSRPALLFYCQHSLGMGHLVRTLHLIEALREDFHVVLLSGGRMPVDIALPADVELVELPPLGMDESAGMVSLDARYTLEAARRERLTRILAAFERCAPRVVVVELFPFGRKKLAGEIVPLLEAVRTARPRPLVLCSLRDILVSARRDQAAHDARAVRHVNEYFDAVLMHTDPAFARIEESCTEAAALRKPVYYTGFVTGDTDPPCPTRRGRHILVSAGGGMVGKALYETTLAAHARVHARLGLALRIVTGPFYPEEDAQRLKALAGATPATQVIRSLPSLMGELCAAAASISQCGYNTAMDLLCARVPALVVPYAAGRENEQSVRAQRLANLGLLRALDAAQLTPDTMAAEMQRLAAFRPATGGLNLDGARHSARLALRLLAGRDGVMGAELKLRS